MTSPITLVNDLTPRDQFTGNGVQTTYSIDWAARTSADVAVEFNAGDAPNIGYTFNPSALNDDAGFDVIFNSPPPDGTIITVYRRGTLERQANYGQQKQFTAATVNAEFADYMLRLQELKRDLQRTLRLPISDPAAQLVIPDKATRSGKYATYDENGNPSVSGDADDSTSTAGTDWGSDYGLVYDGETDQAEALQAVLTAALAASRRVVRLISNEGALVIGARVKVPAGVTLDTSQIKVNYVDDGELSIFGDYEELPETSLFRLAADAEPGDTTITVDASDYGSYALLAADSFQVLRGENDINGNAIQRHEYRQVGAINDAGGITALVITIDPPIPDDQGTFTPINVGSAWEPGETGVDRSLVTVRTASLLAGNVARGDLSFDVADGSLFTAGAVAMLQDDRLASDPGTPTEGQPMRQEMVRIRSISTNTITLEKRVSRDFLTASNAALIKINAVENAHIIGGRVERVEASPASPASRRHAALMYFADRCSISGIDLDEDTHTYSLRGQAARATRSIDCKIFGVRRVGPKNTSAGDGVGIGNFYSTDTEMWGNYTERCRHGMQNQGSTRANRHDNLGVNNLINTLDDHGIYETDSWDHDNKAVGGGSLAADSTQQLGATYGNTRWLAGSHFAVCENNVFLNFAGTSDGGVAIRQASGDALIRGNKFAKCTTGVRVLRDSRGGQNVTTDVVIRDNHFRNCTTNVSADGGLADWAVDVTYSGTTARPVSILASNGREYSTDTTKLGGSEPTHTDSGETDDWTDLGAAVNGISGLRVYGNDPGSGSDSIDSATITGLVENAEAVAFDNTASGMAAANVQAAIDERVTIVKTAAGWTADVTTVLAAGALGLESDTSKFKFGNGSDLWSGLSYAVAGTEHDAVTIAKTQPDPETSSFTLGSTQTETALSGQVILDKRFVTVDPAAAVDITLNSAFDLGEEWYIYVVDEDYTTTLVREHPQIDFVGDVENGSAIITNIGDKTGIENGYTIDLTYFPAATTVVDKDYASTSIQVSAVATGSTTPTADLTLDAGPQGTINGVQGDFVLRKGWSAVKLLGKAFGADVLARGDIAGGGGPFTQTTITATTNTNMAGEHFGKSVLVTSASGTPTYTFLTEANYGAAIQPGTWIKFFWDGAATSFTFVQGSGTTLTYPDSQTLAMIAKGVVTAEYLGSEEWVLSGALVLA
jgi:hypothetical protein